jgi:hypothetical protein
MWTVKLYRLRYLLITNLIPLLGFSKYTTIYCLIKKIDDDKYVTYRYIQCNYIIIIIIISISIFYILWAVLFQFPVCLQTLYDRNACTKTIYFDEIEVSVTSYSSLSNILILTFNHSYWIVSINQRFSCRKFLVGFL